MRTALILAALLICDAFNEPHWRKIKYDNPESVANSVKFVIVVFFLMDVYELFIK